ncbi:MAG: class I SAM-dependent methyltransferase, partial [Anaerolineae bacterium]|nr:class I SAM-dependent methyltransferase [Anaerolineae bacterium]
MGLTDRIYEMIGAQARKPSGWFGKITGHSMAWQHKPLIKWAITLMDVQPTDHVLDVGCGSGVAIKLIAKIAVEGFVAGVDYSEEMAQQALRRNAAAVRAGRVEIKHGDVAALPYDDESFDKVIATETFNFWPDPVANLKEVRRVMQSPERCPEPVEGPAEGKPGGLVALAMEGSKEAHNWQKLAALTARMGLSIYSGVE